MTTKNIEWLIGRLRAFSGTSLAPALMHQAADTLQSQAERVKALELDLDVQAGSIEAVQTVNARQAELIDRLRAMYVANGTNYVQAAADKLEAQAERIKFLEADRNLEKKMRKDADEYANTLRAQLVALEADYVETREELQEANDSLASTYHILGERDAQLAQTKQVLEKFDELNQIEKAEPVIWAISYDGVTPYTLWHEGDGPLLDCEVKRQGGTTQKMPLFARPMPPIIGLQDVHDAITSDPTLAESNAEFDESQFKSVEDLIAYLNKLNSYRDKTLEALSKYKGAK